MQERLKKRGIKPEQISLSRALPILIAAADESIDELQELWARLLAAAADPARAKFFRLQFIQVVKQMDPLDAAVLQAVREKGGGVSGQIQEAIAALLKVRREEVSVSLDNLTRLNLMDHPHIQYHISALGREFLLAISD
jgi:hypothetical protein